MLANTAGTCTTAAIKTDGTLWMWGFNNNGQCGTNRTGNAICTPVTTFLGGTNWKRVCSGGYITSAIKTDGTLWTWGFNGTSGLGINLSGVTYRCTPVTTFLGGTNWKSVSTGGGFSAAIKTDGSLWVWGTNAIGEMGNLSSRQACTPVTTFAGGTNWKQLDCGWNHTMAITSGTDPTFFVS
jgi:alpha-tubulin suppressor-like RCC1 family protein